MDEKIARRPPAVLRIGEVAHKASVASKSGVVHLWTRQTLGGKELKPKEQLP
jgi:hypothetical protein